MTKDKRLLIRYARCFFVLLLFCYALAPFHRTLLSTLGVELMEEFNVGGGLISVMGAAFFYPYAVMQIPAGILADRWGARRTLTVFLTLTAAGTFFFAFAGNVITASLGRMLIGVGVAMMFVPGLRVILNWFPVRLHPLCTGMFLSLGSCGMLLASWPLSSLAEALGWRWAMAAVGFMTCVLAMACGLFLYDSPEKAGFSRSCQRSPQDEKSARLPLWTTLIFILKHRTYWGVSLWFFCLYGVFYAFCGLWAGPYLEQGYGLEKEYTSLVLAALSAGAVIGPSLHGIVLSCMGISRRGLMAFACLAAMAFGSVPLIPAPVLPIWLLPAWGFCFTVFVGGAGSLGLLKIQEDFPSSMVGTATGMVNIYTALGGGVVQMCSGWIMEALAPGCVYDIAVYSRMFLFFWVLLGAGCASAFLCQPDERKNLCAPLHMASAEE